MSTARCVRRQVLERGDERELHALALLVARLGRGEPVLDAEQLVGVRLDPDRSISGCARAAVRVGSRPVVDRQHALRAPLDLVQAGVRGDRVEPRAAASCGPRSGRARATRPARPPGARPRRRAPTEHPVAVRVELPPVRLDQAGEGRLVAAAGRFSSRLP